MHHAIAPHFEGACLETSDKFEPLNYIPCMPAKAYRPIIRPKGLHGTVPIEEIRRAVREVKEMRKNDPAAHAAMVKRNAHRKIIIVPDRG